MSAKVNLEQTAEHWGNTFERIHSGDAPKAWWDVPAIKRATNMLTTGAADVDWIDYACTKYFPNGANRFLSLGCGDGNLERSLASSCSFERIDGFEVSPQAVQLATKLAAEKDLSNIFYSVEDINTLSLDRGIYDAVWVSSAMHHFSALEHICAEIEKALKPEGLLIFYEYVGPNRFQFSKRQKEIANLCWHLLPDRYRVLPPRRPTLSVSQRRSISFILKRIFDKLRDGSLLATIRRRLGFVSSAQGLLFPTYRDVVATDPTEAIRSQDILNIVAESFDIVEKGDVGSNIYQFLLADIAEHFIADDECARRLIEMVINIEQTMIACKEFESDTVFVVARPKSSDLSTSRQA